MNPTVGRIVHYQSFGVKDRHEADLQPAARAAIITDVPEPGNKTMPISLAVLNPTGMYFNQKVYYSEQPKAGHWSWPPKV